MASAQVSRDLAPARLGSPWWDRPQPRLRPALRNNPEVDAVVVGAGIVGTTAALMLQREGLSVALLEARRIAAGTSGSSTAKVTSLHGLIYSSLVRSGGEEAAAAYARANQEGVETIARWAREMAIDCDLRERASYTYAESASDLGRVEAEVEAARAAGLPVEFTEDLDLPFPVAGAVRLGRQAEFDPVGYLRGLADALDSERQSVFEQTRVVKVAGGQVQTETDATVRAEHVIVATQLPIIDRGLHFARTHPMRSYAVTARLRGPVPQGMYLSTESPAHSLRAVPREKGELLIVGGGSHNMNVVRSRESFEHLERYARERFEVERFEHRWGAHDYMSEDGLPYVGPVWPGSNRILIATGMHKWGYALGTASARILADSVLGRESPSAAAFSSLRGPNLRTLPKVLLHNGADGISFVGDRLRRNPATEDLKPGEGRVVGSGLSQAAVHRDEEGQLHAVSARCTHLGCIVRWNGAERSWDCPCHGSRFSPRGEVLTGPAVQPLEPRRLDR